MEIYKTYHGLTMMTSSNTVLVIGASGFVGTYIYEALKNNFNVFGTYYSKQNPKYIYLDLFDVESLEKVLNQIQPQTIIVASGSKNLKWCEENKDKAFELNGNCLNYFFNNSYIKANQPKIIYISSDYVFDGINGNYKDNSLTNPTTVYGKSKMKAEELLKNYSNHMIIRTSAIMGKGGAFFDWLTIELKSNNNIEAFCDSIFTPTPINLFTFILQDIIQKDIRNKTIHLCGGKKYNRYEFISYIAKELFSTSTSKITPIEISKNETLFQNDLSLVNSDYVKDIINQHPEWNQFHV